MSKIDRKDENSKNGVIREFINNNFKKILVVLGLLIMLLWPLSYSL